MNRFAIGVDLGGTNIVTAVADARGRLHARSKIPTDIRRGPKDVLKRMAAQVLEVFRASGLKPSQVLGVGVGSPGPLNAHTGVVLQTPNLVGWKNVPLARILKAATGFKVKLDNDARAAALAEAAYGAGKGCDPVVVLTLGTGVGGGIIVEGKALSGPDTCAGELGHMALDPKGPPCNCGQVGCLEQYASATGIARMAREALSKKRRGPLWKLCGGDLSKVSAKMAHQALLQGDPSSKAAFAKAGWALGTAVAGYINIFNPERVILAGGVMLGGRELLADTTRIAKAKAFPEPARRARIVRASLGDDAGVIGAALIARQTWP